MIICGLDLETTGLDPKKDVVTEIGAVLWDTQRNSLVGVFNRLLKIDVPVPELIVRLTGIDDLLLSRHGIEPSIAWQEFDEFQKKADYIMAHNAPFDRGFCAIHNQYFDTNKQWIDTSTDVDYPEDIQTRKLTYLAAEHKIINPFAHRAITDVLTMCQVASQYDWHTTVNNALTPNVAIKAMVTFDNNTKAKALGFRWDAPNKLWVKNVKETKLEAEFAKCIAAGFVAKKVVADGSNF